MLLNVIEKSGSFALSHTESREVELRITTMAVELEVETNVLRFLSETVEDAGLDHGHTRSPEARTTHIFQQQPNGQATAFAVSLRKSYDNFGV